MKKKITLTLTITLLIFTSLIMLVGCKNANFNYDNIKADYSDVQVSANKLDDVEVFSDEDTVFIKNEKYINKSVIGLNGTISFNEEGICEMKGIDAKRFLTIPGYTYVKKG